MKEMMVFWRVLIYYSTGFQLTFYQLYPSHLLCHRVEFSSVECPAVLHAHLQVHNAQVQSTKPSTAWMPTGRPAGRGHDLRSHPTTSPTHPHPQSYPMLEKLAWIVITAWSIFWMLKTANLTCSWKELLFISTRITWNSKPSSLPHQWILYPCLFGLFHHPICTLLHA